MSSFDFGMYDSSMRATTPTQGENANQQPVQQKKIEPMKKELETSFDFGMYDPNQKYDFPEQEEGAFETVGRYLTQIPAGVAQAFTWPAEIVKMMGVADATDPEEIDRIKNLARNEAWADLFTEQERNPKNIEQKYMQGLQQAEQVFPTQANIERGIEYYTGLPLAPKTRGQNALRFLSSATTLSPQGWTLRPLNVGLQKPVLGAGITAAREGMKELGVPEPISDIAVFGLLKPTTTGAPSLTFGSKTKPSGLKERFFETKGNKEISSTQYEKLQNVIEQDARQLVDKIVSESPIAPTVEGLLVDPAFKSKIIDAFEEVSDMSRLMPGKFQTLELKTNLADKLKKTQSKVITPSEYENAYESFMRQFIRDTPDKPFFADDVVAQYRRNNRALSEIYEVGKSGAYNRAKKDAYLDYNRIIADFIESKYPNSEFSNIFKETNKRWAQVKDAEFVEQFMDDLFNGKIDYRQGRKAFDKNKEEPFKRALGEENFTKFKQVMEDLLSTENAMKKIKVKDKSALDKIASAGTTYILHPKVAIGKVGYDAVKQFYNNIYRFPKLTATWKEGLDAFKKGDTATAQAKFTILTNNMQKQQQAAKKPVTINLNNPPSAGGAAQPMQGTPPRPGTPQQSSIQSIP